MKLESENPPYKQLTHEVIKPISRRSVAFTIGGTVLFLALLNWGVLWLEETYPYNRGYWLVNQKWEMLHTLVEPVDWLILGDSTGNQGIVPDVLEERFGGTAVNLNTVGNMGALDDVWMLEEYISRFGPPSNVLIVHSYDIWSRDVEPIYLAKTPLPWNSWQQTYAPVLSLTSQEEFNAWLARFVPLYADNISLGLLIRERVYLQKPVLAERYHLQPDGFMKVETAAGSAEIELDLQQHLIFVAEQKFELSEINQRVLSQLIFLAEENDIEVYLAFGPVYEALAQDDQFQTYFEDVRTELQSVAAQSEQLHLLGLRAVFPANQMENVDHLIFDAAKIYTNMIVDEIEKERP